MGRRRHLPSIVAIGSIAALTGLLVSDLGTGDELARGVAALPGGAALAAGEAGHAMTAARYLPDGTLDPAFGGGDGIAHVSHDPVYASAAYDVAVQPDGKVVLAGVAAFAASGSSGYDIAVARLNPDGTRDASFGGGDGAVYLDLQGQHDWAMAVAINGVGRIVVAGHSDPFAGNASEAVVLRLLPDGSLDPSFGNQGVVVIDLRADQEVAYGLALQADGAILAAGAYGQLGSGGSPWLARLRADGTRDRRFGRKGVVTPSAFGSWYDVTVQPDGRIVTAGEVLLKLTVARYLPNGQTDASFGTGGMTSVQVDPNGFLSGRAAAVATRADGTILAVGDATATNVSDMVAVSLLANGTPDARFGSGGVVYQHDPSGWNSSLQDVALLPDGSALAAGYLGYDWALARYTPCA
jgi:uncharacterized delta-60 repeat protein